MKTKSATINWVPILVVFILLDSLYSFFQHYHFPIDGDFAAIVLPAEWYTKVLHSPFGLDVLSGEKYGAPNRFFVHWFMSTYFRNMPIWLQSFLSPTSSIYASCAILKILTQLCMAGLFTAYITGKSGRNNWWLGLALVIPFFQTSGYNLQMGLIESSITYACFFSLPLGLLLAYFLPYFRGETRYGPQKHVWQIALATVLPFSGPLVPAIVLLVCPMIFLGKWIRKHTAEWTWVVHLGYICLLSLWSMYVGTFNIENPKNALTIVERYQALMAGLGSIFIQKLGLPLLLAGILFNLFLVKKFSPINLQSTIFFWAKWALIFSAAYLLLLPLGGFRIYRPLIIRHDTVIPVTMVLALLFGLSTFDLLRNTEWPWRKWYVGFAVVFGVVFTLADLPEFDRNACEKAALENFAQSTERIVKLDSDCPVMSWKVIRDTTDSRTNMRLLHHWGIAPQVAAYFSK